MPPQVPALPPHFNVEPELREQLGRRPGLQRCVEGHEELLLIVHDLPRESETQRYLFFWRRHDGRWTQAVGPGLDELASLLDRYGNCIDARKTALVHAVTAREIAGIITAAGPLQKSTAELEKALEQALSFDPLDTDIRELAERSKELARAAKLLLENARMNLEFLRARQTGELNANLLRLEIVLKRMAVVLTLFLPLIAILLLLGSAGGMTLPAKIIAWLATCATIGGAWLLLGVRSNLRSREKPDSGTAVRSSPGDSTNSTTES